MPGLSEGWTAIPNTTHKSVMSGDLDFQQLLRSSSKCLLDLLLESDTNFPLYLFSIIIAVNN